MSSDLYLKATFDRFRGTLYPENGKVEFEGMIFINAYQAVKILKELSENDKIKTNFMYKDHRGFQLCDRKVITIDNQGCVRTFLSRFEARSYISRLKKRIKL